jgi:hypothetical protein
MSRPVKHYDGWRIRWVDAHGERKSRSFHEYNDAKRALAQVQHELADIRAGLRTPMPPNKRFDELCDYWVLNRAKEKRSGWHDVSIIRAHLRPHFGNLLLREIGAAHRDSFVASRSHLDKKTIHNHLTLLISMLHQAEDLGWLDKVPRIRKPKVRLFTSDFRFLRTDDEIRRFLNAARDTDEAVHAVYATAVYTGMRAGDQPWDAVGRGRSILGHATQVA